ncbi:GspH/FimT family pseudopilin [Shewanella acanthi]|uniref:GspH/FimT family pseudopilin n=1 Tax=Shewanella acanthi TaxID=2864212 RepID=UPI001C656DC8|nr:GspH/FimT family pseudopilin [Shewanella acanthi]QYJ78069.1 GspH/FimT family pseudopilin [Shewanella acanthi]
MNRLSYGFTLIELLVTITVAAILLAIGIPSLVDFYTRYRADSNVKQIQQTLMFARNHAISLGRKVSVCALVESKCSYNWQVGVSVFIDANENNQFDGDDSLLNVINAFSSQDTVSSNRIVFRFRADGLASGTNGTIKYCPSDAKSPYSKSVIVNQAGRARISTANDVTCN